MNTIRVNSHKKADRIVSLLNKQGRMAWFDMFYYTNFPAKGFGIDYIIFYKEV